MIDLDLKIFLEILSSKIVIFVPFRNFLLQSATFVAKLLSRNGVATLVSFTSPSISSREAARQETTNFIEMFAKCPVEVCITRDVKGSYKKAFLGKMRTLLASVTLMKILRIQKLLLRQITKRQKRVLKK